MSKRIILGLVVMILIVGAGYTAIKYVFRDTEKTVESASTEIRIAAGELLGAFESDEQKANELYLDKIIEVSGRIDSIIEDESYVTLTLKNKGDLSGVLCSFDKSSISLRDFTTGSTVSIKGQCTGYLLDVVLVRCVLVN